MLLFFIFNLFHRGDSPTGQSPSHIFSLNRHYGDNPTRLSPVVILLALLPLLPSQSLAEEDWVKDELLTQMYELRVQLGKLDQRVKDLEAEITALKSDSLAKFSNINSSSGVKANAGANAALPGDDLPEHSPPVPLGNSAKSLGSTSAEVAIIEFTDFSCGYCRRHHRTVFPSLQRDYVDTGKVRYIHRDYHNTRNCWKKAPCKSSLDFPHFGRQFHSIYVISRRPFFNVSVA